MAGQKLLTRRQKLRRSCVVWCCFSVRILVDGFWASLGIFLIEWQNYFSTSATKISWLGSICSLILWMSTPIASALSHKQSFRVNIMMGGIIATSSLLATSLAATSLEHIFTTFAILCFGLGLALLSVQSVLIFNFTKHLGIAASMANTGTGFGTFIMPPLFQLLLNYYGWRGCLLVASALYANIAVCGALVRPTAAEMRMRKTKHDTHRSNDDDMKDSSTIQTFFARVRTSFDISLFYTNPSFIAFCIVGLLTGLCYNPPVIYLAAKAVDDGVTKFKAALLISIIGLASTLGRILGGILIDCKILTPSKLCGISYALCGIITLLFPIGNTFSTLAAIAFGFGFTSGVYNCMHLLVAKEIAGLDKASGAFAWFLWVCAISSLVGFYLSGYLKDATGQYEVLFLTAGGLSILSAIVLFVEPCLHRDLTGHRQIVNGYLKDATGQYEVLFLTAGGLSILSAIVLFVEPCLHRGLTGHRQIVNGIEDSDKNT